MPTKLAALMQQAAKKLAQMDYGSVIQLYQKALALAPNNAGAAMGLVMVFNRVGKPGDALALLHRLWPAAQVAKGPDAKRFKAAVLAQMGVAQQQLGQLQTALETFTQAQLLADSPDLQRSINQIRPLVTKPEPIQQLLMHAHQLVASNRLDEALQVYAGALQMLPDNIEALRGLAALQRQRGAADEALAPLQKALVLAPDRPELYNELGMVFQDRGDLLKAITFHKRAIKVDEKFTSAHINLGVAYKRLGKNDEAIAAYRSALALEPDSPQAHNNLGNLLRIAGDLASARVLLERALALRPGYTDAQANLYAVNQALGTLATPAAKKGPAKKASASAKKVLAKATPAKKAATKTVGATSKASHIAKKPAANTAATSKTAAAKSQSKSTEKHAPVAATTAVRKKPAQVAVKPVKSASVRAKRIT